MSTLILSADTGGGHNACANAIKEVYDAHGDECVIKDGLSFVSEKFSRFISRGHTFVYRHLSFLFAGGYKFAENHPSLLGEASLVYRVFASGAEKLCRFINEGGYDTVICTHIFSALMLTEVQKRYNLPIKTAFLATDYTCSPGVKSIALDLCFIPDNNLKSEFECDNIPPHKIIASGIPVSQRFYGSIKSDSGHIVMMCGSMGCGPMKKLVNAILDGISDDTELTVVCGTNKRLAQRLRNKYGEKKNVHIKGFVNDIAALLEDAALYITKPGGISVTEAAVKGVPMALVDAVAGCEEYNMKWFVSQGTAVTAEPVSYLADMCIMLASDKALLGELKSGYKKTPTNAAVVIFNSMKGVTANEKQN